MFSLSSSPPFSVTFRMFLRLNAGLVQDYSFDILVALSPFKGFLFTSYRCFFHVTMGRNFHFKKSHQLEKMMMPGKIQLTQII